MLRRHMARQHRVCRPFGTANVFIGLRTLRPPRLRELRIRGIERIVGNSSVATSRAYVGISLQQRRRKQPEATSRWVLARMPIIFGDEVRSTICRRSQERATMVPVLLLLRVDAPPATARCRSLTAIVAIRSSILLHRPSPISLQPAVFTCTEGNRCGKR